MVNFRSHEHGIQFELCQDEIKEILLANGWEFIGGEGVGSCGLTDHYRVDQQIRNKKTGQIQDASYVLGQIWKFRFMKMMTQ